MKRKKEVYCIDCKWLYREDIKRRNHFYHIFKHNLNSTIYHKCNFPDRPDKIKKDFLEKKITKEMYCVNLNTRNDCKNFKTLHEVDNDRK